MFDRKIFDLASTLAGGEVSETVLRTLCSAAARELEHRLRDGVSPRQIRELFVTAAGVLALSMYIASGAAPAPAHTLKSFRAGNLSVSCADPDEPVSAASLRRCAERMLSDFLRDEGFAFLGVRS